MMIHFHPTSSSGGTTVSPIPPGPEPLSDTTVLDVGLDDLAVGSTRLVRVGDRRVCVARTESGVYAVDHACPHEGYGLTQGNLDGELLTCAWHNWKFDVRTGACVVGQDDVPTHDVAVGEDGSVAVTLRRPDRAAARDQLFGSLRQGIERDYVGQIARGVARLLAAGADPSEIAAVGVVHGVGRAEWGWGHSIAALTDSLALTELFDGEQRAVPLVQGLSFVADTERDRPERLLPEPAPPGSASRSGFLAAVEREDLETAQSLLLGALADGASLDEVHDWLVGVVAAHHLSYGHGAIYAQKGIELVELIGADHAALVLGHLVTSIVFGTREDTLPYFRPFGRVVEGADVAHLASIAVFADEADGPAGSDGSDGDEEGTAEESVAIALRDALLGDDRGAAASATVAAVEAGLCLDRILDTIVEVVAERLLRHDPAVEFDLDDDFNWLDITHGLTYAHAARFHLARQRDAGRLGAEDHVRREELVRLVLFCAFQANWTGRHEWHAPIPAPGARQVEFVPSSDETIEASIDAAAERLQRRAFDDEHVATIHVVHAIKTSRAAAIEVRRSADPRLLDAVARYFDGPRQERGVRATAHRSIEFVAGRLRR